MILGKAGAVVLFTEKIFVAEKVEGILSLFLYFFTFYPSIFLELVSTSCG